MSALRFGFFIPQGWRFDLVGIDPARHWAVMTSLLARADANPAWESVWVYDHFHTTPVPSDQATHEAWSLMAGFAAASTRVRLGQMCTCMAYRNPVYLAKVAATIDHISGGRLEMGIGAGWYEHEWRAFGYGFPRAGIRLAMLDEGVQIFRQAWETGTATLEGEHYRVDGAICQPTPLQKPSIPLWIAGGGEKVTLKIAAKYAQYTNFDGNAEGFAHKSGLLAGHCRDVGTDFEAITRSSNFNIVVGATEREAEQKLRELADRLAPFLPPEQIEDQLQSLKSSPGYGTPEQIAERISAVQDLGLGYAICYFPEAAYDPSGLELFETQVMPELT